MYRIHKSTPRLGNAEPGLAQGDPPLREDTRNLHPQIGLADSLERLEGYFGANTVTVFVVKFPAASVLVTVIV